MAALAIVTLAACGNGDSPGDGGIAIEQACTDDALAICTRLVQCSNGTGIIRSWTDLASCQAREKLNCVNRLHATGTTATPATMQECARSYPTLSCADFNLGNFPTACAPIAGPLPDGAICLASGQCRSTFCSYFKGMLCGTCAARPRIGDDCTNTACGPGLFCFGDNTCEMPLGVGGTCDPAHFCAPGLSCRYNGNAGVCQKALTGGAHCDPRQSLTPGCDFRLGLYCNGGSHVCTQFNYVAAGSPCGAQMDGSQSVCSAGAICLLPVGQTSKSCLAPAADDMPCDLQLGPSCTFPARCVTGGGSSGTCQIPDATKCK